MGKTDYLESQFVLWCVGKPNDLFPTSIDPWLALYTSAPTDGTPGVEVNADGYARLMVKSYFAESFSIPGELRNIAPIIFGEAVGDFGTVVAGGILPGQNSTTLLRTGAITPVGETTPGIMVPPGEQLVLPAGHFIIREG